MKIKKRTLKYSILIFILIIILSITAYYLYSYYTKDPYQVKGDTFSYSANRGKPEFSMALKEKNETYDLYAITFKSRNFLTYPTIIYGLLFLPHKKEVPGLVLLPGGGVTKEAEASVASKIASWDYAVLTFDQRGLGETGGYYLGFEQDYQVFSQGNEPINHLSVYDALAAYDVLRQIQGIDKNNIALAGESMGGRYAMIATSLDKRVKGFIGISTAGFHFKKEGNIYDNFLISIDPDHYIESISPRPVFMLHSDNDSTIPLKEAETTFALAGEPKSFFIVHGCNHGYCDAMEDELKKDLNSIFGK